MKRKNRRKNLLTTLPILALIAAPSVVQMACDHDNDAEEAMEELKDEAGDAKEAVEDEIDDHT